MRWARQWARPAIVHSKSNAPRQPRRDSGVGLDAVVGLLPVGLIPIPPIIIQEANRRAMENGDLTFGHGFALGLALCASWGLCAAAIWIKRAIVRRFRKANPSVLPPAAPAGREQRVVGRPSDLSETKTGE